MFRRSRLSIKPNVKPGGRGSSQTAKEDDKAHSSVQQPSPERKTSNEKDASESPAVLSVPPAPLPNLSIGQEERDDPDEQQENVPINKNDKNDKTGEPGVNSKLSVAPLQRRKRFSTMPNLAKPRSTSVPAQPSSSVTPKSPPQQQNPLNSVPIAASIQGNASPSQTSTTDKPLTRSQEKRKPSSGQDNKLPEKKTPIPQVPQFSPVKSPVHKDPTVGTNSARPPVARKILSSPLKERVTPSSPPTKGIVPSPSHSPARPKSAKIPSDLERLRKARKLREMLKEELRKEKKARRETIPIWETGSPPERTKMTMRDFIYYLPDTNPMLSSFEDEKRPPLPVLTKEPEEGTVNSPPNEDEDEESDDAVLGPRVKVAEDGSIIIDEESLTVEVLRKKGPNIVEENDPIFERGSQTTYSSFRKSTHSKPWSNKETDMFFLAISMVGTDFSMIGQLFPNRTRIEIKNKFKREEKLNSWRIDKAFKEKKPLDLEFFGDLLTRVLEAESKKKKERNEKIKSQVPRKPSTTKRNRKGKKLTEIESDPDDPDPVEVGDTELVEADADGVVEGTEASCSGEGQEDTEKRETISKPLPTKRKRKRKKEVAADLAVQKTAEEPPQKENGSQEPKQKVRQCKKGIQKSSTSNSDQDVSVGEQIAEGGDEYHMVNGEISTNQGTSENKRPSSETKRKEKSNDQNKPFSDHESVAVSEATSPVTTENDKKSQHVRLQKPKPNLKVVGRKRAGGKGSDKTASEAFASYDDVKEDKSDKLKESSGQDQDATNDESSVIMNNEMSEKEVSSVLMPETIEGGKTVTEEILANKAQDAATESRSMEKPEEPRAKPALAVRSRFQKPKPNLGRAIVKKDVSTDEGKVVAIQDKSITTKEVTELSPNISIIEGSDASETIKTGSETYFAPEARTIDTLISNNMPIQQDAVQGPSREASESIISVFQSKAQSPEAVPVPSNSVELQRQNIIASDTEISRRDCQGSNKMQQSERTFECDNQDELEDLKLDSIQDNIISKPTRSGRQPRPTAFYKSPEQKPSTAPTLLSEGENEDKGRSRRVRYQKAKLKVSKGLSKKETQTKNAGKGQGASKMRLVTLRASQEDDDDDEPELIEEDDIYLINPEEVNKAPAFVPISLRSPEPVQTQVEETMEELEIAVNVSDKNYDSETEQSFPELPDKSDPSQSCTLAPGEDYHPATADQIELFVEVIEIASEDTAQEEDDLSTEVGDGLQDTAYTGVSCVDEKSMEHETVLGSDPPSMQVVVYETTPDVHTESSKLGERCVPIEKDLKDGLDLEEPSLSKEDSHNAGFSSSSVIEQSDNSQTSKATRRCRFLKPKPNLPKTTSRSQAENHRPVTKSRAIQNSVEPSETTLQNTRHGNETEGNLDDTLQLHPVTVKGDEQNLSMEQASAEQLNDKVSIPVEQDNCVGNKEQMNKTEYLCEKLSIPEQQDKCVEDEEQMSRAEHLDDEVQHMGLRLSISAQQGECVADEKQLSWTEHLDDEHQHVDVQLSIPEQQDKCVADEEQLSRIEHLDDEVQHVGVQLSISEQQGECVADEEQLSRTEHLDDEVQHVGVQLSIPEQQDKCVADEEQLSRTEHLDDEVQHVGVQLSISEQQGECVADEEQLSRTEHLDDEDQHVDVQLSILEQQDECVADEKQLSRTEHLDDEHQHVDVQLSIPEQQDKCVADEEQLSRTEQLDDEDQHVDVQLSILEQQDECVADEEQLSRTEHLDDEHQHVDVQLSIPEQQDKCVADEEQLSKTEHLYDEAQHVGEQLSIPVQQDKRVEDEEQLSRTEHLDDEDQHVDVQLSIPEQQDKCVADEEQLSRTEHLYDEAQHVGVQLSIPVQQDKRVEDEQLSRTEHLDDEAQHVGVQLSIPVQQDKRVEDEEQLSRTEHLDAGTEHPSDSVFPAHDQLQTTNQSQEAQVGFSSAACFTQSTLSLCQTADAGLPIEAPETTAEVSYFDYSQKVGIIEAQNVGLQETLNVSEENLEHMMTMESPNEETFILTLVEIPVSSLMDYNASSTSVIPVLEDTLTVAEPILPLPTENVEVSESVSSEPSMETTAAPTVSESVPLTESIQQQWSLNKPGSNIGQMDRKRKVHGFNDNQDFPAKKSPTITSLDEESIENVRLTERTTQSNLVTCTSLEDFPATATSSILRNDESTEGFTSTPLDNVVYPVPVETAAETCSVSAEEMKKSGSQKRRGKLTVKPNISTKRATCIPVTSLPAKNKNSLKLSRTIRKTLSPCVSKKGLHPELACNLSVDMNSAQWEPGSVHHNQGQTDAQGTATVTESAHSTKTLAADTDAGTTAASDAGTTAASDAGTTAASDAGTTAASDAGTTAASDAGTTAASDAGTTAASDAGTTAASDAGTTAASDAGTTAASDAGTTAEQSEMAPQNTASTSVRSLMRPGRKPRGFLSFISKKSSEKESETKPQKTKYVKPRMNLPRFAGKRTMPSGEDAEETKANSSPPAKRKLCEEAGRSSTTEVICNSSLQSWQSESYTEEACCAVEQDTEQMQPTRVAEYFFSDIFTEVDEDEQE
ncbi:transcription factor TFIIIB component B'' homolog [Carcharodon carcharias]|uniref:transcription factor TFIIIB component B'' homolog n=1 Tax=Carcharodon carcharias TaxID=13397 RepID=UPI001B7ED325|nr:transcription factor TFIIIB component B'' homolog [Carcharodon carcharias]